MKREEFLQCIQDEDRQDFVSFVKTHKYGKSRSELEEHVVSLGKDDLESVWDTLKMRVANTLLNFQLDDGSDEDVTSLEESASYLEAVVAVAMVTVQKCEPSDVSPSLQETTVMLHGVLLSMPEEFSSLSSAISKLCELWWVSEIDSREEIVTQTILYLLRNALQPSATQSDVKRIWAIHECLLCLNLQNHSSESLCNALQHSAVSPLFLKCDEGRKFLAFVFNLDTGFIETLHRVIKGNILQTSSSCLEWYGEVYFRAWKSSTGTLQQKLEEYCIQDLMYHAIIAQRTLAASLRKILKYIHRQKVSLTSVDEMLLRLYDPIMWRFLKAANGTVRYNALCLLTDAFPLRDTTRSNQDNDELLQRQFDIFSDLLNDECPLVRSKSVIGICQIFKLYWGMIPDATIQAFLVKIVKDLAWDGASVEVRVAVLQGLIELLENHLSHPLLKKLLPTLQNMLHDNAERVRLAFLELLLRVKPLCSINYWSIAPVEHLQSRLESDTPKVNNKIVLLLSHCYVPTTKTVDEQLSRCMVLMESSPAASRVFFSYLHTQLTVQDAANLVSRMIKEVYMCVWKEKQSTPGQRQDPSQSQRDFLETLDASYRNKSKKSGGKKKGKKKDDDFMGERDFLQALDESLRTANKENEGVVNQQDNTNVDDTVEDGEEEEEEGLKMKDTDMIQRILEAAYLLLNKTYPKLQEKCNSSLKNRLLYKLSHILPELLKSFSDPQIVNLLLLLAGFVPANHMSTSKTLLSKLRRLTNTATECDYGAMVEAMCKWLKGDEVLQIVCDWLKAAFTGNLIGGSSNVDTTRDKRKSGRKSQPEELVVPQPELALNYLNLMTRHAFYRDIVLTHNRAALNDVYDTLKAVQPCIEKRLTSAEPLNDVLNDQFLVKAFEAYCKLEVLLHGTDEHDAIASFNLIVMWTNNVILAAIRKRKALVRRKKRKLMTATDATMVGSPGDSGTSDSQSTNLGGNQTTFIGNTFGESTLNDTLSNTIMSSESLFAPSGGASDSMVGGLSGLASQLLESLLTVMSNMLLAGVGSYEFVSSLAEFSIKILELEESSQFLTVISQLIYQVTEFIYSIEGRGNVTGENNGRGASSMVPNMLIRVLKMIALLVKHKKEQAERLLPSIKPAFCECMAVYYRENEVEEDTECSIMQHIVKTVHEEMVETISKDSKYEERNSVSELPTLSAFLLSVVLKKQVYMSSFGDTFKKTYALVDKENETLEDIGATCHLMYTLNKVSTKGNNLDLQDCMNALHTKVNNYQLSDDIMEDSPIRDLHSGLVTLVSKMTE